MQDELNYLSEKMFEIESEMDKLELYSFSKASKQYIDLEKEYEILQNIINVVTLSTLKK